MSNRFILSLVALPLFIAQITIAQDGPRAFVPRAPKEMKIDGDLSEFKDALCTPVEYFNADLKNRAAQFFYMWDDEAFYAGLRTLDQHPFSNADDAHLWEGDGVEWYFDTRQDETFRSHDWPKTPNPGAAHCYWSGLKGTNVVGRFCLRPGFTNSMPKIGVQVAAKRTKTGMDIEFKLPWANFPDLKPKAGTIIALDAELCYSDGDKRIFRAFTFGSPLNVQQPASLGKVQLVEKIEPENWAAAGPVMFPIRCDTAWKQSGVPEVTGTMAIPSNQSDQFGKLAFRILGLDGKTLGEYEAKTETFSREGNFQRAIAHWPVSIAAPGMHHVLGIVYDKSGKELTRVAPRLVSVHMEPGY